MSFIKVLLLFIVTSVCWIYATVADSIHGCGGFVEASSPLIKARKASDVKLDYSHITIELRTLDGLVKDRTQCAPNGYYFIPVYDKGSFVIQINGPEGWSWDPDKVRVVVDDAGCNGNKDINYQFTGFTVSGRVVGSLGGESCPLKEGGPSNVKVELLSQSGDLVSSVVTSSEGIYLFTNIIPGKYELLASHPDLKVETRGPTEVDLGFGNAVVDNIFFVPGEIQYWEFTSTSPLMMSQRWNVSRVPVLPLEVQRLSVMLYLMLKENSCLNPYLVGNPILGVHVYFTSDDVSEVECLQGSGTLPGSTKALCHAVSDAQGKFTFKSLPCGRYKFIPYYKGENTVFDLSISM